MEERPLECTLCKRKACIVYRKIKNGEIDSCRMCSMCPILQENIGIPMGDEISQSIDLNLDRKCPNCHTSLHDLTIEGNVGCATCYQTFEEFLVEELSETGQIPLKAGSTSMKKKSIPLHLSATPEIFRNKDSMKKLESLQSALTEALTSESYERAAHIRDQIKTLTERLHGKERKAS